ncbi:hypothetical protein [Deferrisoma palaeochoriense]
MLDVARRWKRSLERNIERWRYANLYSPRNESAGIERHVREAAAWLKRAQDAGHDRGVSYGLRFGGEFLPSYPETTGYIIPTFLTLAEVFGVEDFRRRAVEMGDWEIRVQMECGAVMGGRVDFPPSPAVFNTGMVMLGWLSLYHDTGEQRFLDASERAAAWLVEVQESDGRWQKGNSRFADGRATVYNTRVAWALAWHGTTTGNDGYVEAAVRNAEYALQSQRENGWFADCCLSNPEAPLVHTLAYATRGLLELGVLLDRQDFVAAARRTADALLERVEADGHLPGRFNASFEPAVRWCCMTGSAQMSVIWAKLFEQTGHPAYLDGARRVNRYLMARHDITNPDERIRGGVPGAWPVWGDYGRLMILNWATKFFVDALLAERCIAGGAGEPHHET